MAIKSLSRTQRSRSMLVGNTAFIPGGYEYIAHTVVDSGGASSITFSSIPQTYQHLQVRYICKGSWMFGDSLVMRFNSDNTSANYPYTHYLSGNGASASSSADNSSGQPLIGYVMPGGSTYATTGMFACGIVDILDYRNTNKYKTMRNLYGAPNNFTGSAALPVAISSSVWVNTNAVSTITFTCANTTFVQYSHFALYGIQSA